MTIAFPAWLLPIIIMGSSLYALNAWTKSRFSAERQAGAWMLWIALSALSWIGWWFT